MRLFNSLTQRKEDFQPLQEGLVTVYSCGPTVYDFPHIGNLRTFLFGDILCRTLRHKGFEVHQVMNITDVDDKTIARSIREGVSLSDYTQRYARYFREDLETMRIEPAWQYPLATRYIPEMLELVQTLLDKGHAYVRDGNVYFDIGSFAKYGKLAGVNVSDAVPSDSFSRLDADEYERDNPHDFVLWKAAREGEPSWESPWGQGRPGWHIECSAMSMKLLGPTIDIHTGAVDLLFPHHENEIAQSEGATDRQFVRYWVHGEHLLVNAQKMSKSLGNFYTLRDLLDKGYDAMAIRHQLMSAHYRHQLNFTLEGLEQSAQALARLWDFADRLAELKPASMYNEDAAAAVQRATAEFEKALDDDLNIPEAMSTIFELMRLTNPTLVEGTLNQANVEEIQAFLKTADEVLGFIAHEKASLDLDVEALIEERIQARKNRNFARADEIRNQLAAQGIVLEDGPQGTRWRREG